MFCFGFLLLALVAVAFVKFSPVSATVSSTSATVLAKSDLLQFTSHGQVIGFQNTGFILASPTHMLKIDFLNSNNITPVSDSAPTTPSTSTTLPSTTEKAAPLTKVTYSNVWNGIDIVYEANKDSLMKSTYYVDITKQGVSPDSIKLHYNRPLSLDKNKSLTIKYDIGTITESAPLAWQIINNKKVFVPISYKLINENDIGFTLGAYTPNIPIVIDPTYTWNPFLGGSGSDTGHGIAVDVNGNVYVSGYSSSTWGSPVRAYTDGGDAFVAKLSSTGILIWNTFLGGNGEDYGFGVAVDTNGNVYATGYSNDTWGVTPVRSYTSSTDAFVVKLDSAGVLTWNTFLGGSREDQGNGIAVDISGNVYVTGTTSGATWGSPVKAYLSTQDAFAAKISSAGALTWNTFVGRSSTVGQGIAVDTSGNVYIAGSVGGGSGFASIVRAYTSSNDGFVVKFANNGALTWTSFLGGNGGDESYAIAVDTIGNIYVTGLSDTTWGSPVRAYYGSSYDIWAAKLDTNGALTWNTFLGDSGNDYGYGIAIDINGNVYVVGYTSATWGSPVRTYSSGLDVFAAKLDGVGTLVWNTFLGGNETDVGYGIAIDINGNVYIGGAGPTTWESPTIAHDLGANTDAFVAKLTSLGALTTIIVPTITPTAGSNGAISPSVPTDVTSGGSQSFTLTPSAHYHVADVLVDSVSQGAITSYTFSNVTGDHAISATFAIDTQTVTFNKNGGDTEASPTTRTTNYNTTVTLPTAPTKTGYTFSGWNTAANGSGTAFIGSTAVVADVTVYAQWTINSYTLTYTAGSHGSITGTSPQTINYGSNGSEVTAVPNAHYHFVNWSDSSITNPRTDTNITDNLSFSANFAITTHTLTPSSDSNGSISPSTSTTINDGDSETFTIIPNNGYRISDIQIDGISQGTIASYTFSNVTDNHTISVTFARRPSGRPIISITPPTPVVATPSPSTSSGQATTPPPYTNTTTVYNFGTKTLKNGSTGDAVKELQRFLNAKLNLNLTIDGKLGPKTILVIKAWQKAHGLTPDGLIGAKTKERMKIEAEKF
ncbi:MAG: SBBP repeat-containing protein [Candidatus Nomurabacteria bacterium]|nr:SBBP repeat-containing protein [Candidatus Nomurabacteria bacterium]